LEIPILDAFWEIKILDAFWEISIFDAIFHNLQSLKNIW
jgi:hypothetical protein